MQEYPSFQLDSRVPLRRGILQNKLLRNLSETERVLLAISGGADSVALLLLTISHVPKLNRRFAIGHVHHGTGDFADRSEELTRQLCQQFDVECVVERVKIGAEERRQLGFEAAARRERYNALQRIALSKNAVFIATAHTSDDLAETVLMTLLRGGGLSGIAALKPERGRIVRPLLQFPREQLRSFIEAEGIPWLDDPANEDERYTRVKIRKRIAPLLREQFGAGAFNNIARSASYLQQADDVLSEVSRNVFYTVVCRSTKYWLSIDAQEISGYFDEVILRVLRFSLAHALGVHSDDVYLDRKSRTRLLQFARKGAPGTRNVFHGVEVTAAGDKLVFSGIDRDYRESLNIPGEVQLIDGSLIRAGTPELNPERSLSVQIKSRPGFYELLDADQVGRAVTIRPLRPGDRYRPLGSSSPVKVNSRLRRPARERVGPLWVVEDEHGKIAWVPGERISDVHKLTEKTKHILSFQYEPPQPATPDGVTRNRYGGEEKA